MATNTAGTVARDLGKQLVHYLRRTITVADAGNTVNIGTIPAGAVVMFPASGVLVHVAFDGDATNTLDVGPSTDAGTNLWGTLLALGTIGFIILDETVTGRVEADTIVSVKVVCTANQTVGTAEVIIAYIPDNDL